MHRRLLQAARAHSDFKKKAALSECEIAEQRFWTTIFDINAKSSFWNSVQN